MKNQILDIFKENLLIKVSFLLIIFFPIILLSGSAVINLVIVIMNVFFLTHIFKEKKIKIFNNDIFYFLLALWGLLILNTLLNENFIDNYSRGFGFIRFILLIFSFSYFISYKNFRFKKTIFDIWTIFFIIVSLDLIFEFFLGFNSLGFKSAYQGRLSGFMGDELKIGHWYLCFSLIILSNSFNHHKKFYLFIILLLIVSFMIGERANFIRLVFVTFFFLLFTKRLTFKSIGVLLIVVSIIAIIGKNSHAIIKSRFIDNTFSHLISSSSFKEYNEHNPYTPMYITAYEIFKDNKVIGVGLGSYLEKSHEFFRQYPYDTPNKINKRFNGYIIKPGTHPHQHHFEILATMGLTGYLFLLAFLLYFFYKSIKFYKKKGDNINLSSFLIILAFCIPFLPTGSFFTTYGASIFWLNFSLMNLGNFKNIN